MGWCSQHRLNPNESIQLYQPKKSIIKVISSANFTTRMNNALMDRFRLPICVLHKPSNCRSWMQVNMTMCHKHLHLHTAVASKLHQAGQINTRTGCIDDAHECCTPTSPLIINHMCRAGPNCRVTLVQLAKHKLPKKWKVIVYALKSLNHSASALDFGLLAST